MSLLDTPVGPKADDPDPATERCRNYLPAAFEKFVAYSFGALSALTAVFVVMASDRGIDLTDQALYLAMVDEPVASIRSASAYQVLVRPLYRLVDESIVHLRLLRAALDIGADVVLGMALVRFSRQRYPGSSIDGTMQAAATVALVVCGGFTMWVWAPNGFGYNELGSILLTLLTSLLLLIVADPDSAVVRLRTYAFAFGVLFAGLMITRWTASIGFGCCAGAALIAHHARRNALALLGAAAAGSTVGLLLVHVFVLDLRVIVRGIAAGTTDVAQGAHAGDKIFGTYLFSLDIGLRAIGPFLVTIAAIAAADQYRRAGRLQHSVALAVMPTMFVLGLLFERAFINSRLGGLNRWGTALGLMCVMLLVTRFGSTLAKSGFRVAASEATLAGTLVATPIIAALGSDNPIFVNAVLVSPVWIAAALLLIRQLSMQSAIGRFAGIGLLLLVATVPIFAYEGLLVSPNRIYGEQNIAVTEGRFEGLHVDEQTHQLFGDLESLRQQLDPKPTVLSFWFRPAVLYGLDGQGIGFPWYTNFDLAASAATIEGACLEDGATPTGQVVIVTEETNPNNFGPVQDALRSCGIDFPNGFEERQTLITPRDIELTVYVRDGE